MAVNWTARALTGALTIVFMTQPGFALASRLAGKLDTPRADDRPVAFDAAQADGRCHGLTTVERSSPGVSTD